MMSFIRLPSTHPAPQARWAHRTCRCALALLLVSHTACVLVDPSAVTPAEETPAGSAADTNTRHVVLDSARAQRFDLAESRRHTFAVSQRLPGRVVATAVAVRDLATPLLIFETPDLSQAYAEYLRAHTELARTRRVAERLLALSRNGAAAGKDVDDAEVDALQAESHVRESEARLREAGLDPTILARLGPGAALVSADLPEARIGLVRVGAVALVDLTSFPDEPQRGRVVSVSDAIDPQTRTARVAISVGQPGGVRPGMFASVLVEQRAAQAVAIPRSAVVQADARTFAFVRTAAGTFERRELTLGPDDGTLVAVLRGIEPGEQVVTSNVMLLKGLSFGY